MNERQTPYWAFGGGLDLVTPAIQVPAGRMISGRNFEPWINGGYRRIFGFERYDGRPKPSDATWTTLFLTDALLAEIEGEGGPVPGVAVGNTLEGQTSDATGVVIYISEDRTVVHLTKVDGTFVVGESLDDLTIPAGDVGEISSEPVFEYAESIEQESELRYLAEAEYRSDIVQVPGLNPVRGIWQIRDRVYAFRDNNAETACVVHKATASGWDDDPMTMAKYIYFTGGDVEPDEGDTLTGGTSAATAKIHRIIVHTGAWGTNDAAGYLVLTDVTGTFVGAENLSVGSDLVGVANGGSVQFAFPPGGRYDFRSHNFYASDDTYRVYGVSGVGPAFEIDEDDVVSPVLLDLSMGDAPEENKPFLVECFDGRLWLAFPSGSVQHSITGSPLVWNGFLGAAEYGLGEEITGMRALAGNVLVVRTRRETHGFYPVEGSGYFKKIISDRAGGVIWSEQELDTAYAADDSGITSLARVEVYGDFASATLSDLVQPFITANIGRVAGSMVVRESNQLRILFTNGEGLIARMRPDGVAEYGILSYPQEVHCAYSCEDEHGNPTNWFGGKSGHVYQDGIGRNFDGEYIEATCRMAFNHFGSPSIQKRWHLLNLELSCERSVELLMSADLDYADGDVGAYSWHDRVVGGGGFYDVGLWDRIYYDAQQFSTARFELTGSGKNISPMFYNRSRTTHPFILQGAHLHYTPRRVQR